MNTTKMLLIGGVVLAGVYLVMRSQRGGPSVSAPGQRDRSTPIYGTQTVTSPVVHIPALAQYSVKQAITDIPALIRNFGGGYGLMTPAIQSNGAAYADSALDATGDTLGGYYNAGDQQGYEV